MKQRNQRRRNNLNPSLTKEEFDQLLKIFKQVWEGQDNHKGSPEKLASCEDKLLFILFYLTVIANSSHLLKGDARSHLEQRPNKQRKSQSLTEWCAWAKQLAIASDFIKVTRGRNGATFAHWQIGLAYAKFT